MVLLLELHIDRLGDGERVGEHVVAAGKERPDLVGVLEVQAVVVPHAVAVVAILAQPDAQQHVVCVVIVVPQEVRVVRGDDGQPEVVGQRQHLRVQRGLAFAGVRLHFEVVAIPEQLCVPRRRLTGLGDAVVHEVGGHLAGETGGGDDESLAVGRQQFAVDPWLRIEAFGVSQRAELDQIAIPLQITGKQHEVVVRFDARGGSAAGATVAGRDVGLHAQDGLDAGLSRLFLELPGGVHVTVICNRQRGLLVELRALDQIIDAIGAVEERILGVAMQVDERHGPRKIADHPSAHHDRTVAARRRGVLSWRLLRRVTGGATALLVAVLGLTPTGCYISRAAYEEARILSRRQPIDRLLIDSGRPRVRSATTMDTPALDAETLDKLRLVSEARQFAISALDLKAGDSFTQYSRLDRDTLVLVLSAAYRDRLERKTWWFPVVGTFPYKGFFDFDEAKRTSERLSREGFDVTLGPSSAFSTLGWFNDPLVSTTVKADSVTLVNTIIHELLHNTFFAKGRVSFNESFATFVGGRGAEAFFRARGDSLLLKRAEEDWQDDLLLGAFWQRVASEIDSVFAALPDSATTARIAARDVVYAAARQRLVDSIGPQLHGYPPGWTSRVALNNAVLLSRRVYAEDLAGFDAVFEENGRDLKRAIEVIVARERAREES